MKLAGAALLVLVAGCMQNKKTLGPFVRSAEIVGPSLVLERCTIVLEGDTVGLGPCTRERRALCGASSTSNAPAHLDRGGFEAALTPQIRDAAASCGRSAGISGPLAIRLRVNYAGRLLDADPTPGRGRALADCVGDAIAMAEFPRSLHGGELEVVIDVSPAP